VNNMKVAIGSKNPVKLAAVEEAFKKVWPDQKFDFFECRCLIRGSRSTDE